LRPDIAPTTNSHIPEQISMIETLIEKGHANSNGNVYFDVSSDPEIHGKLSGRKFERI